MDDVVDLIPNGETVLPVKEDPYNPVDLLGRQEIVDRIMKILEVISEKKSSCTFALNGAWGTGKTFVLNILMNQLWEYHSDKYIVFHYNCWQYDYYEEPLIAIVAAMLDSVEEKTHLLSDVVHTEVKAGIELAMQALKRMGISLVKNKIGVDLTEALSAMDKYQEAIDNEKQLQADARSFDVFYSFKKAIAQVQDEIRRLAATHTLVVVVDELDRCLPDYSIRVLERLHHLFTGINRIAVVLAVDKKQLDNTILEIFGQHTNTTDYLRKFIDFELHLHSGRINEDNVMPKLINTFGSYFNLNQHFMFPLEEFIASLFDGIPIRVQEKMMSRIRTAHDVLFPGETKDASFLCCELAWLVFYEFYGFTTNLPFYYKDMSDEEGIQGFKLSIQSENRFTTFFNNYWSEKYVFLTSQYSSKGVIYVLQGVGEMQQMLIYYLSYLYSCESKIKDKTRFYLHFEEDPFFPVDYRANKHKLAEVINFLRLIH